MADILGFDVGGTKTGWGIVSETGELKKSDVFPTPRDPATFITKLSEIIKSHDVSAIGIGMPGTIRPDRRGTVLCTNIPELSELDIASALETEGTTIVVDNDAHCALIGEVWQGAAQDLSSAVMVTLGTGVGGAVMQKGMVRPHPNDVGAELARIVVDPTDVFPAKGGSGTVEAFLGGRNLEERFQIDLQEIADAARKNDEEAIEIWHAISYYFIQCMKTIHAEYSCSAIIIGGIGSQDLDFYLQDPPPCPVIPAKLGPKAAIYGAARIALDKFEEDSNPDWE